LQKVEIQSSHLQSSITRFLIHWSGS
jgi:hypothetical protein